MSDRDKEIFEFFKQAYHSVDYYDYTKSMSYYLLDDENVFIWESKESYEVTAELFREQYFQNEYLGWDRAYEKTFLLENQKANNGVRIGKIKSIKPVKIRRVIGKKDPITGAIKMIPIEWLDEHPGWSVYDKHQEGKS